MVKHIEAYTSSPEYKKLFDEHGEFIDDLAAEAYAKQKGFHINTLILHRGLKPRTTHSFYTLTLYASTLR